MSEDLTTGQVQTAGEAGSSATPGTTGAATPPQTGGMDTGTTAAKTFTQADVDRIITERLAEQKKREQTAAKKAADDAEAKRLAEQGQFEALARQHADTAAAALTELETVRQQLAGYEAMLSASYETRLKALPKEARKAVEGIPGLSVAQRLAWLEENAALFTRQAPPDINTSGRGTGPTPGELTDADKQRLASKYNINPKYIGS